MWSEQSKDSNENNNIPDPSSNSNVDNVGVDSTT